MTEENKLISMAMRGPCSDWKNLDGTPVTRSGFYADWNHRHEEGETQDEADAKLIAYFHGRN